MKIRNLFVGFVGLLLIAVMAVQSMSPGVDAQDATGPRLDAVETQVAAQATTIAKQGRDIKRLKDRVSVLEGGSQPADGTGSGSTGETSGGSSDGNISFTGTGSSATDPVDIAAGSYTLAVSCDSGAV